MERLKRWLRIKRTDLATLLVVAVVLLVGWALFGRGSSSTSPAASRSTVPAKYVQTWPKKYDQTTCREWTTVMSQQQMWATAADMLGAAQSRHGATSLPSDQLVSTFRDAVSTACVIDSMTVADAGVGVYLTERVRFKP